MKGCELAAVARDPSAEGGPFVLRISCADGTRVPDHWHPTDENPTVLKGIFLVGMGETFDQTKLIAMKVESFTMVRKEMRHFAVCKGETIVQIHGAGPFKVNWLNPTFSTRTGHFTENPMASAGPAKTKTPAINALRIRQHIVHLGTLRNSFTANTSLV